MLVVSIFDLGDGKGQQFRVAEAAGDGSTVDVTAGYEVHALEVQAGDDLITGWHIGKRTPLALRPAPEVGGCIRG